MIGTLIFGTYLLGWPLGAAWVARKSANDISPGRVDMIDATLGCIVGLFWPLFVFPAMVLGIARMETPLERRERLAVERDAKVREQARAIARLERELGIK